MYDIKKNPLGIYEKPFQMIFPGKRRCRQPKRQDSII